MSERETFCNEEDDSHNSPLSQVFTDETDDEGVSIVVGAVLLVGITIILGAVFLVMITGTGIFDANKTASAAFSVEETPQGAKIMLAKVNQADNLRVLVGDTEVSGATWAGEDLGEEFVLTGIEPGDEIVFVGNYNGEDTVVQRYTVKQASNPSLTPQAGATAPPPAPSGPSPSMCSVAGAHTVTKDPADGGTYNSIVNAVAAASAGETVEVCDSKTYAEAVMVDKDISIVATNGATMDPAASGSPICGSNTCAFYIGENSKPTIEGFDIISGPIGIYAPDSADGGFTLRDITIDGVDTGVYGHCDPYAPCEYPVTYPTDRALIEDVTVTNSQKSFYFFNYNGPITFRNIHAENIDHSGINLWSADGAWIVEDSSFVNTAANPADSEEAAIEARNMKGTPIVRDVTIDTSDGHGIHAGRGDYPGEGNTMLIERVTIRGVSGAAIYADTNAGRPGALITMNEVTIEGTNGYAMQVIGYASQTYTEDFNIDELIVRENAGSIDVREYTGAFVARNSQIYDYTGGATVFGRWSATPDLDFTGNCWYDSSGSHTTSPTWGDQYQGNVDESGALSSASPYC